MEILDGKFVSKKILEDVRIESEKLIDSVGRAPGLTVVIVGEDPASAIYVRSKEKKAKKLGFKSEVITLKSTVSDKELSSVIQKLNNDNSVDGILIQLPLPQGFDTWKYLDMIDPKKDVDRFHPVNLGMILLGRTDIFPCTPSGIIRILDEYNIEISGKNCAVAGRSYIVGKPVASMLTNRNATVTLCHSKTRDLEKVFLNSDIIVSAVGKPGFINKKMVKEGAVLIDVGINRIGSLEDAKKYCSESEIMKFEKKGYAIAGDISPDAYGKASFYTPVPGGIGLMTVAMLMENTFRLFKKREGV